MSLSRNVKSSITDPIEISEVTHPDYPGKIGITICPGKKGPSSFGGVWDRDLLEDLRAIKRDFDPVAVITLMSDSELSASAVPALGQAIRDQGMQWLHLPMSEMMSPRESFVGSWENVITEALDLLKSGVNVLVHDRGGLGRAGVVAAVILIEFGMPNEEAINLVRRARPGAIETVTQENFVRWHVVTNPRPHIFCRYCFGIITHAFGGGASIYLWFEYQQRLDYKVDGDLNSFPLDTTRHDLDDGGTQLSDYLSWVGLNFPSALRIFESYIQDWEHYIGGVIREVEVIRKALRINSEPFPMDMRQWGTGSLPGNLLDWFNSTRWSPTSALLAELTYGDRDLIGSASRKIARYIEDYRDRTKARDRENIRSFSSGNLLNYLEDWLRHLST